MNRTLRWLPLLGVFVLAIALVFGVACGDDDEDEAEPTPSAPTATQAPAETPDEQATVVISLDEWTVTGAEGAAIPNVPAGEVAFEVHNDGTIPHELVVIKTDTDPAQLPVVDARVDEEAAGEEIGEVEEFPAGEVDEGTFVLSAGTYALICNIPAHYEEGMYAQLIVE